MPHLPAYERIRAALRVDIQSRSAGDRLPSESDLAARFGVTRVTVRQALSGLAAEGLVVRQQGRGTFVADRSFPARPLSALMSFSEDVEHAGGTSTSELITSEITTPPEAIREALGLTKQAAAIHIGRIRCVDNERVALQHAWIPAGICPNLAHEELIAGSLYRTLEERYGIRLRRAERRITAVSASKEQATQLRVAVRSPLLQIEQRTFDETGRVVEFAGSWTRPGYALSAHLER